MNSIALALVIGSSICCDAQVKTSHRFAVTSIQVANALMQRGFAITPDQISLPTSIVSSTAEPSLNVDSIEPLRSGFDGATLRFKVKLVCSLSEICIPFYAIVGRRLDSASSAVTTMVLSHATAEHKTILPPLVHVGTNATLVIDSGRMHIQIPVICLQNGSIGSRIRVLTLDRKQRYSATIVSSTQLSGSL